VTKAKAKLSTQTLPNLPQTPVLENIVVPLVSSRVILSLFTKPPSFGVIVAHLGNGFFGFFVSTGL
jgi:hypothetical protein